MDCSNLGYAVLGVLVVLASYILRPHHAQCPVRWHNNGIRPSGAFVCSPAPIGDPDWDGTFGRPDRSMVPSGCLSGQIVCTGGRVPIVVDDRTVGCQNTRDPVILRR